MSDAVPQPRGLDVAVGTQLEPFLRGFQERGFQTAVGNFVRQQAFSFAVACPDGSHPLNWTCFHNDYRNLFEQQLDKILLEQEVEHEEFHCWISQFQVASELFDDDFVLPGSGGVLAKDFCAFMNALTASENYDFFLKIMFDEVRRQQLDEVAPVATEALPVLLPNHTKEIDVVVPDGLGPGQAFSVEYLGIEQQLVVPDGHGPGSTFKALASVPEQRRSRFAPLPLQWS